MPKGIYDRIKSKPQPRKKFFHNKRWLEEQYLILGKSTPEIAKELGMKSAAINHWLVSFNVPIRNKFKASNDKRKVMAEKELLFRVDIPKEYLIENFVGNKKTVNQIAAEFNTSWDTIRKRILRWGLKMREKDISGGYKRTTTHCRRFQKNILRHYGYKCAICGYDKFVNCCHISKRAYSGDDTIENGIVLCPNHHAEFDYGLITMEEIKKYQVNKEKVRYSEQSEINNRV